MIDDYEPLAEEAIASGMRTLRTEASGLNALADGFDGELGEAFAMAVATISQLQGRVIVTGVGKSGHVGAKMAATFASTGTPSFFVHPSEANHGDLGMIARDDAIVAISWSGETVELKGTLAYASRFEIPLIALTSRPGSTLAKAADIVLILPREEEACPLNLAPTTSSLLTLAMGDALAVALLEGRRFTEDDFGTYHPGGQLGAKLTRVREVMHSGTDMPLVSTGTPMSEAILLISEKGFGCVGVTDGGRLAGVITDGDLRRKLVPGLLEMSVDEVMTPEPKTVEPHTLLGDAVKVLQARAIQALWVADEGKPVGIVHFHDLLKIGVV